MSPLHETLLWLCSIPSPIGEEKALCDAVEGRLGRRPLASPVRRYGDSIVVPVNRGSGGPAIALAGHLDVVRTVHEGPARIEGDRLYGAGAADMKSGLALMLHLIETCDPGSLRADLTLVFYAREEGPFADNELGPVLAQDPELKNQDFAVCLEPSDNRLQLGCNGSLHARVTFHGSTAHSSRPWQGDNAIHKAAGLLADLGRLEPVDYRDGDLVYRAVTSATMAQGGRGRNIVPDVFELNLNHRFTPGTSLDEAKRRVLDLVAGRAEVAFLDESPSAPTASEHPETRRLIEAGVAAVEPKQAWTDVARFAQLGVAAVNFGPGVNAQAHQRNEWTSLALLDQGDAILRRWLLRPLRALSSAHAACSQAPGPYWAGRAASGLPCRPCAPGFRSSCCSRPAPLPPTTTPRRPRAAAAQARPPAAAARAAAAQARAAAAPEPPAAQARRGRAQGKEAAARAAQAAAAAWAAQGRGAAQAKAAQARRARGKRGRAAARPARDRAAALRPARGRAAARAPRPRA